jgi:hypothetical protein
MNESDRVGGNLKLQLVIMNSYFKDDDFKDPIKKYLKTYYLSSVELSSVYYYMLLSSNDVTMNDAALYGSPTKNKYIETRVDY